VGQGQLKLDRVGRQLALELAQVVWIKSRASCQSIRADLADSEVAGDVEEIADDAV